MVPEARPTSRATPAAALTLWLAGTAARRRFDASVLSSADRRRWARFVSVAHRAEWMSSRALLAARGPAPGEVWSLSHSGGFAALLTGPARMRIGVDLERVKQRDFARLARFGFDAREIAALSSLPARARPRNFYIMWTLKEAAAKALGISLWRALRECVFVPAAQGWLGRLPGRAAWCAWVYAPRRDLVLAVVCIGAGVRRARAPRCREWPANGRKASAAREPVRPPGLRRKVRARTRKPGRRDS